MVVEGGSCLVGPMGRVLCDAGREEGFVRADMDLGVIGESQAGCHCLRERRPELYGRRTAALSSPCGVAVPWSSTVW